MRLSEAVEWAIHSCAVLVSLPHGAALPGAKLAEFHELPGAYLAKHLASLARAGIVEATVGRQGGYRLARPPAEITLWDIVAAVEGEEPLFRCTEIRRRGPAADRPSAYKGPCGIALAMRNAEAAWRAELERVTLADVCLGALVNAPPASVQRTAEWMAAAAKLPTA